MDRPLRPPGRPCRTVVRGEHLERGGAPVPLNREAAELAALAEVELQPGVARRAGVAVPAAVLTRERLRRPAAGKRGRRACDRGAGVGTVGRERRQREVGDPHRAAPSGARGDRDLDRRRPLELAAAGRPPGERDLTLPDPQRGPLVRERKVAPRRPPHVVAARVHELELEVLGRGLAADAEGELVVVGQLEVDGRPTAVSLEVEVETHRRTARPGLARDRERHPFRWRGLPPRDVRKVVQHPRLRPATRSNGEAE